MRETEQQRAIYERWVEQHGEELFRFAQRLCGRREQAEDLVQETFYHAWRSMGSLREKSRGRAWLFRILRHRYSHLVRTASRRPRASTPLEDAPQQSNPQPFTPLEDLARSESLQYALDQLEEQLRTPLLMAYMEGLRCREIAEQLDLPLGTVLSRIHRARQKMRRALERQEAAIERRSVRSRSVGAANEFAARSAGAGADAA